MQSDNNHKPCGGSLRTAAGHGWLGRSMFAAAVLGASLGISACGSSAKPAASATILNTRKVEQAIANSALAQRGERALVSCPAGVHQTKGLVFSCTAVVGHTSTRFVVDKVIENEITNKHHKTEKAAC